MNERGEGAPVKDERMEWNVSQLIEAQHIDKFCSKVEFWIRAKGNVEFPSEIKIPCEEFFLLRTGFYIEKLKVVG